MELPGYSDLQFRCQGSRCAIYAARRQLDNQPVILKRLRGDYPSPAEVARFRREYEITRQFEAPGIIRCRDFITTGDQFVIVLEDFGGRDLNHFLLAGQPLPLGQCLDLMLQLTQSLSQVHRALVLHKDLNPANLVWNPETNTLKLIDFGIASRLSRETPSLSDIQGLEGTLAYMSPEQTGRMNRAVDSRSDLYALGVTFYQLLTGRLPFLASDPLEMVHAHIARSPQPPHHLHPEIPEIVSQIVLKLLAKTAEERYQSSYGLGQDLQQCLREWQAGGTVTTGTVTAFALGAADFPDRLTLSQALYGRDTELEQLLAAFERCCEGEVELVLVAGFAGIGKTALVNEIHRPVTAARGEFSSGKYDQFNRGKPYAPLVEALSQLVPRLLSRNETELEQYRQRLIAAIGGSAPLLIDLIPEFGQILGAGPAPVEQAADTEAETRFLVLFRQLLRVLATPEHPLVLFIDDLQWADLAGIRLLQRLVTDPEAGYLLLVGAYRDSEVSNAHPLMLSLAEIRQTGKAITELTLAPLSQAHTRQLVQETLRLPASTTNPLADLCFQRTQGNPFFLNQLLESLYTHGLLSVDVEQGCWRWDLSRIAAEGVTEDMVSFLIAKLAELPPETERVLQQAAVVGNRFDLAGLTTLLDLPPATVVNQLQPALHQGLVLRELALRADDSLDLETAYDFASDPGYNPRYRFLHDRVQQAAYALLSPEQRLDAHYRLGRQFWSQLTDPLAGLSGEQSGAGTISGGIVSGAASGELFTIVNHLNQAQVRLTPAERLSLARLNLEAGVKAKQAAAFQAALELLQIGVGLLPADAWQSDYELAHGLYTQAAIAAYLANDLPTMERLNREIFARSRTALDTIPAHEVTINALIGQNQLNQAIDYTLQLLHRDWREHLPEHPQPWQVLGQFLQTKLALGGKSAAQLAVLPTTTDAVTLATMRLRRGIMTAAYYARPNLLPVLAFSLVRTSLAKGIAPESPFAFAVLGLVQCSLGDEPGGYELGQTALKLAARTPDPLLRNRTWHIFNAHLRFWKETYGESKTGLREVYKQGLECGDLEYAAFGAMMSCAIGLYRGDPLETLKPEMTAFSTAIADLGQGTSLYTHEIHRQVVFNLTGDCANPSQLVGAAYNEVEAVPIHEQAADVSNLASYYCAKAMLHLFLGDYDRAAAAANANRQFLSGAAATVFIPNYYAYDALIQAQIYAQQPVAVQRQLWQRLQKNRHKVARWATLAPVNYSQQVALIDAELARLTNHPDAAIAGYEQAITLSHRHGFVHQEALACELAGRYYLSRDQPRLARTFLRDARYLYEQWGAVAKVQRLDQLYPELRAENGRPSGVSLSTTSSTADTSNSALDFASIIRSSQTIAKEIVLERLLETLMQTVLATAGAQTGLLLLERQGTWQVVANQSEPGAFPGTVANSQPYSPAILNYVIKSRESVVLDDATQFGPFTDDPYVVQTCPKSVLCTPLLNQGQLNGVLYLENNLATAAFTPERVEVLQILSAQAAISLQNAQLYVTLGEQNQALALAKDQLAEYSRTLEQKVAERTQELSQTLDVLKATQAELRFENDLLRSAEVPSSFSYQVGGSLPMDAPTYVVRSADRYLYKALRQGQFCYVLNARQMGKSSLMVQMLRQLQRSGYSCTALDLTLLGSETVTPEQWYKGLAVQLWQGFDLVGRVNLKRWWDERLDLSPVQRLGQFFEQVLLVEVGSEVGSGELGSSELGNNANPHSRHLVIFLDEIDSVLGLPFAVNDFFGLIRACYNQRSLNPDWQRLTFALLGVATPAALITDIQRTPFNIGQAISLQGFKEHEAQPLLNGLAEQVSNPQTLLKELLGWTNGQPFLTQKLCQLIRHCAEPIPSQREGEWVQNLVQARIIDQWETQDEPEHLRTIANRILHGPLPASRLLQVYQQILAAEATSGVVHLPDSPETEELLLSGLVLKQQGQFRVNNRIYAAIFNQVWVEAALASAAVGELLA